MAFSAGYRGGMVWLVVMGALGSGVTPTDAQGDAPPDTVSAKTVCGGIWAVQFQLTQNFTLAPFQGALLSLKRHWSPATAIRMGLDGTLSVVEQQDETRRSTADTTVSHGKRQVDDRRHQMGVIVQYVQYRSPRASVSLFWGTGPLMRWGRTSVETTDGDTVGTASSTRRATSTNRTWSAGVSGVLGTEWWVTPRLSVLAEYGIAVEYESGRTKSTAQQQLGASPASTVEAEGARRSFRITPLMVKAGVSVSF